MEWFPFFPFKPTQNRVLIFWAMPSSARCRGGGLKWPQLDEDETIFTFSCFLYLVNNNCYFPLLALKGGCSTTRHIFHFFAGSLRKWLIWSVRIVICQNLQQDVEDAQGRLSLWQMLGSELDSKTGIRACGYVLGCSKRFIGTLHSDERNPRNAGIRTLLEMG